MMTVDSISFDLGGGGMASPRFDLPDASGLAPLALPPSFVSAGNSAFASPQEPSRESVGRFESAMSEGRVSPDSLVRFVASSIPQSTESPVPEKATGAYPVDAEILKTETAIRERPVGGLVRETEIEIRENPVNGLVQKTETTICEHPVEGFVQETGKAIREYPVDGVVRNPESKTDVGLPPVRITSAPMDNPEQEKVESGTSATAAEVRETPSRQYAPESLARPEPQIVAMSPEAETRTQAVAAPVAEAKPRVVAAPVAETERKAHSGDDPQQVNLQAAPVQTVAVENPAADAIPDAVQAVASVQSARTAAVVDAVNEIVAAIVGEIEISPVLAAGGDGEMTIRLKPDVLDGSEIKFAAKGGELTLTVVPATPEAAATVSRSAARLETELAAHAPAFERVAVEISGNAVAAGASSAAGAAHDRMQMQQGVVEAAALYAGGKASVRAAAGRKARTDEIQ